MRCRLVIASDGLLLLMAASVGPVVGGFVPVREKSGLRNRTLVSGLVLRDPDNTPAAVGVVATSVSLWGS